VARGLGSSAASTAAGIVLANTICELGLDKDRVIDIGAALEGHADNVAAAVLGGAVIVLKESASRFRGFPLPIAEGLRLVFAVPRDLRLETRSARAVLPVRIAHRRAVLAASRASALVAGLRNGSAALLRAALDDVLHVPYRRPLVVGFDRVVDAALAAGAFGATLSGSGPSIVALTAPDTAAPVGKAMVQAWKRENVAAAWLYSGARTPGGVVVSSR
jgi:homoserine kinase